MCSKQLKVYCPDCLGNRYDCFNGGYEPVDHIDNILLFESISDANINTSNCVQYVVVNGVIEYN